MQYSQSKVNEIEKSRSKFLKISNDLPCVKKLKKIKDQNPTNYLTEFLNSSRESSYHFSSYSEEMYCPHFLDEEKYKMQKFKIKKRDSPFLISLVFALNEQEFLSAIKYIVNKDKQFNQELIDSGIINACFLHGTSKQFEFLFNELLAIKQKTSIIKNEDHAFSLTLGIPKVIEGIQGSIPNLNDKHNKSELVNKLNFINKKTNLNQNKGDWPLSTSTQNILKALLLYSFRHLRYDILKFVEDFLIEKYELKAEEKDEFLVKMLNYDGDVFSTSAFNNLNKDIFKKKPENIFILLKIHEAAINYFGHPKYQKEYDFIFTNGEFSFLENIMYFLNKAHLLCNDEGVKNLAKTNFIKIINYIYKNKELSEFEGNSAKGAIKKFNLDGKNILDVCPNICYSLSDDEVNNLFNKLSIFNGFTYIPRKYNNLSNKLHLILPNFILEAYINNQKDLPVYQKCLSEINRLTSEQKNIILKSFLNFVIDRITAKGRDKDYLNNLVDGFNDFCNELHIQTDFAKEIKDSPGNTQRYFNALGFVLKAEINEKYKDVKQEKRKFKI